MEINFKRIHEIFSDFRVQIDGLVKGIENKNEQRDILDTFLEKLGLEKNMETRYIASQRLGNWKFEPLEIYGEKQNFSREKIDELFETSYVLTRKVVEEKQNEMLQKLKAEKLLPDFYMTLLQGYHEIGKLTSDIFLDWNKKLLFGVNRDLEEEFHHDSQKILDFLEENDLFDMGHNGDRADRTYSILEKNQEGKYERKSYFECFPEKITLLIAKIGELILSLDMLEDELYHRKKEYIAYFQDIIHALSETDCDLLVEKWAQVDTSWMTIDTPFQPGHMMEYYEDKYRKAVSIEFDFRIDNPELFTSEVKHDIEYMYEGLWDEIERQGDFLESYYFSKHSIDQVQLHIGVPYFSYGSFLCGMYSAQVVPNDPEVSKEYGKKIFAFPSFILQGYRSSPKMKLDQETIHESLIKSHYDFLHGNDETFYKVYDIATIGHEFGHTLWLTPNTEILMNKNTGLFKNIEEFKATAGGMVAYFFSGSTKNREEVLVECLYRNIKMMRYRQVEDVIPYYCECLISLHIFYTSGIISIEENKIQLHITDQFYEMFRETYIATYMHLMHTYLHKKDAGEFLYEYVEKINGVLLPKEEKLKDWVENYYALYKKIGNDIC